MTETLRIALAQLNPHEGEVERNAARILAARAEAAAAGADLVVTPELSIAGYPPEDLILKPAFLDACDARIAALARATADGGPGLVVGGRGGRRASSTTPPSCSKAAGSRRRAPSTSCRTTGCSTTSAISSLARRPGRWCSAASGSGS
jgi:predicted amidohydrolase